MFSAQSAEVLDHPVWAALTGEQAGMALGDGDARRYPREVSPLAALRAPTTKAFDDLAKLVTEGDSVAFFTPSEIVIPSGWEVVHDGWLDQMIFEGARPLVSHPPMVLTERDVPEMLMLTAATEPGPFGPRTIEFGRYVGIRAEDGRLVSMSGERIRPGRFTEASAVCTDPDHRGRGYAATLLSAVTANILDSGRLPMLHVRPDNVAKMLYEKLGYRCRRTLRLTVVSKI